MTAVYHGTDLARIEARVGRRLTAAEQHIQVEQIDDLLNRAKDLLDAEIRAEQRRAAVEIAAGRGGRLEITPRMVAILRTLREHGRAHAANELASMGYPVRPAGRRFTTPDELEGRLRARLGQLTIKVQTAAVGLDLGALSQDAIDRALQQVLGARSIAADIVPPTFVSGLADTFEQHLDLVDQWQYTAVNDAGLCEECAPHDGEIFDTLADLFDVLPDFGPNPDCLGGDRCRCRAVPVPADGDVADRQQQPDPPSGLFELTRSSDPVAAEIRDTLAAIDSVHGVTGDALKIPVKVTSRLSRDNPGRYSYRADTGEPLKIEISSRADDPGFSAAHEIGHYLDHQLLGRTDDTFASVSDAELERWRQAVDGSLAVQRLRRLLVDPQPIRVDIPGHGPVDLPPQTAFIRYLLQPEELFARSYAQWVASTSGDPVLQRELALAQRLPYPEHWSDDDFAQIADAFRRLMEERGWTTR